MTWYEEERQRLAKRTPKQLAREGQREMKIAIGHYLMTYNRSTAGAQYARLLHIREVADKYGIELPVFFRWLIDLHERAMSGHIELAAHNEDNPLVGYPRSYQESILLRGGKRPAKQLGLWG